ncbi:MAG TPA: class I SAM-dependent methyltransferase [Verrucomicrobiae bacterium]|jgi:SAM-dependent methyltransferase
MPQLIERVRNKVHPPLWMFRWMNQGQEQFVCPVCDYEGPFREMKGFAGARKHAQCPRCGSLERHRLQYFVVSELFKRIDTSRMTMLHFAPEDFFRDLFRPRFGRYETADLCMKGVDHKVDLQNLPFADATYDFVFASHVLEHIPDDRKAISEIRRILRPNGLAVLPVPVVCEKTVEYPEANPHEAYHMRAPGLDYFDKYKSHFQNVEVHNSAAMPGKFQLFIYENRSVWPTPECPLRPPMSGERHSDFVPVCYA